MSGRRGGNRIRGPQSALTDFLAANNISAQQIRDDYERRLREAEQDGTNAGEGPSVPTLEDNEAAAEAIAAAEEAVENTRKRKRNEQDAIESIKKAKSKKSKSSKKKRGDSDEEFDDNFDMYRKVKPLPGQLDHCGICNKRFTVTPYSKEGPDGGLLCTPCGKQLAKDVKKEERAQQKKPTGKRRRQVESNRLDGIVPNKAKTLQQLCIEKVAQYHEDVEELGDLPPTLMTRLSEIFSKKRVLNPKTLKLFTRPDMDTVAIHDAAYLEVDDYMQMFAVTSSVKKVIIPNACQMKDEAMSYMMDKCDKINYLQFYAANLTSNEMWRKLFANYGTQLEALKLQWLDATFEDDLVDDLVTSCPNLKRIKFKLLRRIGEGAINSISRLKHLEYLSLHMTHQEVAPETLINLIEEVGPGLKTLSLEHFLDADDRVLNAIHEKCTQLSKLRFTENDTASDGAFVSLFRNWKNQPLTFIDFNSVRDMDNNNPNGPEDQPIGLASAGFGALMRHSGQALKTLDIASCRHISPTTFHDVFDGSVIYPCLESINLSFCSRVDTLVIASIFKSCPSIRRVTAFGCFDIHDVVVPRGVALIGVPRAQDEIEQVGMGIDVEEAVQKMMPMKEEQHKGKTNGMKMKGVMGQVVNVGA